MAMTKEEAQVALYNEVYVPAFLNKCAELGHICNTEEDVVMALETAALVKHAAEQAEAAKVQTKQPVIKKANEMLKKSLGMVQEPTQEVNPVVREAIGALIS